MHVWLFALLSLALSLPDALATLAREQERTDTPYGAARILSYRANDTLVPTGILYLEINGVVYGVPATVVSA